MEKYLAIIRDKAGLLESRISQLIDYVKLDTADWRRSRERIPLARLPQRGRDGVPHGGGGAGIRFRLLHRHRTRTPRVFMDGDLVYRALENLVQNAFRYAEPSLTHRLPAPPRTTARSPCGSSTGETQSLAEDLPFIFEPFFRGTRARREGGFGLGLSVVKSVVSSHGWGIAAASSDGETSFTVTIPPGRSRGSTAPE